MGSFDFRSSRSWRLSTKWSTIDFSINFWFSTKWPFPEIVQIGQPKIIAFIITLQKYLCIKKILWLSTEEALTILLNRNLFRNFTRCSDTLPGCPSVWTPSTLRRWCACWTRARRCRRTGRSFRRREPGKIKFLDFKVFKCFHVRQR